MCFFYTFKRFFFIVSRWKSQLVWCFWALQSVREWRGRRGKMYIYIYIYSVHERGQSEVIRLLSKYLTRAATTHRKPINERRRFTLCLIMYLKIKNTITIHANTRIYGCKWFLKLTNYYDCMIGRKNGSVTRQCYFVFWAGVSLIQLRLSLHGVELSRTVWVEKRFSEYSFFGYNEKKCNTTLWARWIFKLLSILFF